MSNVERDLQIEALRANIQVGLRRAAGLLDVDLEPDREQQLTELALGALTTLEGEKTSDRRTLKQLRRQQLTHRGSITGVGKPGTRRNVGQSDQTDQLIEAILAKAGIGRLDLESVRPGDVGLTISNARGTPIDSDDLPSEDSFAPMTLSLVRYQGTDMGDDLNTFTVGHSVEGGQIISVGFGSLAANLSVDGWGGNENIIWIDHIPLEARFFILSSFFRPELQSIKATPVVG